MTRKNKEATSNKGKKATIKIGSIGKASAQKKEKREKGRKRGTWESLFISGGKGSHTRRGGVIVEMVGGEI